MEENDKLLSVIKVPTLELSSKTIQDVLIAAKRQIQEQPVTKDFWDEVTQTVWNHLQEGLYKFDDQLLCATCFYTVLGLSNNQKTYITKILEIVKEEKDLRDKHSQMNARTLQTVSLMYGIFQSSFLTQNAKNIPDIADLLKSVFQLLMQMAYEYSRYTFIVFKTINSFKKVCGTDLQEILFSEQNKIKLLNVTNHNWENPITGVRDLNKEIFQTLISVMDDLMFCGNMNVLQEIQTFYWNKAKYLMLTEIIKNKGIFIAQSDWIDGLFNSLLKPGLVSAGADMYFALLKNMNSENDCQLFMKPILNLLCGRLSTKKGIENFCNYWILTTLKTYPALLDIILKEFEGIKNTEMRLHSSLCIIKQANKLGLIKKNWENTVNNDIEKTITDGLDHTDNQIRAMAFDALCISHCKLLPTKTEYELVLNFINNNVNSDCTVLRISMLKSLSSFLTQIHISYLNSLEGGNETEALKQFCCQFQDCIKNNIKIGGNYQRKITSIKLAHAFLIGLKEVPRKRQKQTRKCEKSIIQMLKDDGKWFMVDDELIDNLITLLKDPAEDIRDNAVQLLLEHYSEEIGKTDSMNKLIEDALNCMSSKFFYEINCGRSAFKLIINILIQKEQPKARFEKVDDVFNFAFKELIAEYQINREIVESIEKGKQLHSFMSILQTVLEVCHQNKKTFNISNETLMTLLEVLKGISNKFAWESDTSTSSDFSKMSDMVNNLIAQSGYNHGNENDQSKISGLHQIVLNCLWLNVKGSCELSSLLIKYQKDDAQIGVCEKALDIICHVLETCRHKGAIEAAGAALGQSIYHLTSLSEKTELSKLPLTFLKNKLNELISEAAQMASVTRRGAGLSIMVHRIVSSDAERGKPLFHYFMKTILESCDKAEQVPKEQNMDNVEDLPKAIYIHFLTRIVTDSSLASDMMFYSAELAELAFGNLTSPYWQIRNAALQLYGALIQKLIGQKKASGSDDKTVATVACDELKTHSPKLWKYVQDQLKNVNYDDKIQYHSNLVPILNMLANMARWYSFSSDCLEQSKEDMEMSVTLISLLDSPIYTVRRLTAECIPNLCDFDYICPFLINIDDSLSENCLHGRLMLIASFHKQFLSNMLNYAMCLPERARDLVPYMLFENLKFKYGSILYPEDNERAEQTTTTAKKEHSYLCKDVFDNIFCTEMATIENIENTFVELNLKSHMPGIFQWANTRIQKYLQNAPWGMIPEILKMIIRQNESEAYLSIMLEKIENVESISQEILLEMTNILILNQSKFNSSITWKILYKMLVKIDTDSIKEGLDISDIFKHLKEPGVSYKLRYMIPFAARIAVISAEGDTILEISKIIEDLINPETTDVEMRCIAAMANNELSLDLKIIPDPGKIAAVKSAVILLQDEDEDVRILSTEFYKRATNSGQALQPYICFNKMLTHTFLDTILNKNGICILAKELTEYLLKVNSKNVDEYNPFANDSSNIYLEVNVLRRLIESL